MPIASDFILVSLVVSLLMALFKIIHGDPRKARDIAEEAFEKGLKELNEWEKEKR